MLQEIRNLFPFLASPTVVSGQGQVLNDEVGDPLKIALFISVGQDRIIFSSMIPVTVQCRSVNYIAVYDVI